MHFKVILTQAGAVRDITPFCGTVTLTDDLTALSKEFCCPVLQNERDKYIPNLDLLPGDKITLKYDDDVLFYGRIVKYALDGTISAYDDGWFLGKSQVVFQATNLAADDCIKKLCESAAVSVDSICTMSTKITGVWVGKTPSEVLNDILTAVRGETKKDYRLFCSEKGFCVEPLPTDAIIAVHDPADNVSEFDITWAKGEVSGEASMDEMANSILLAAEDDGKAIIGASAANAASKAQFGLIQRVEVLTEDPGDAALRTQAASLLEQADRLAYTREIGEIFGSPAVHAGVLLDFGPVRFGVGGVMRVTAVTHTIDRAGHTMALTVKNEDAPRAAEEPRVKAMGLDAKDAVTVSGLPNNLGKTASSDGVAGLAGVLTSLSAASSIDIPNYDFGSYGVSSPVMVSLSTRFLQVAAREVGYRYTPQGTKYGIWYGLPWSAWCCMFVSWCAAQCGAPIPKCSYVGTMSAHFSARGLQRVASSYTPSPGDLFIQNFNHIGIVEKVTFQGIHTIEGNYSNMVARVIRSKREISHFLLPFTSSAQQERNANGYVDTAMLRS